MLIILLGMDKNEGEVSSYLVVLVELPLVNPAVFVVAGRLHVCPHVVLQGRLGGSSKALSSLLFLLEHPLHLVEFHDIVIVGVVLLESGLCLLFELLLGEVELALGLGISLGVGVAPPAFGVFGLAASHCCYY